MTPEIRKAIYALGAAVLGLLAVLHVVDEQTSAAVLDVLDKALAAAALVLAYRHVPGREG